jgi:prephenate dehydrogenase
LEAADADLYRGALVVVTQSALTNIDALSLTEAFWAGLGARVQRMTPDEHDRLLASTSHLPHLAAALVATTVGRHLPDQAGILCGTGFWDTTRVAEGDPTMWHDILQTNQLAILEELIALQGNLVDMTMALAKSDFEEVRRLLEDARDRRRALAAQGKNGHANT